MKKNSGKKFGTDVIDLACRYSSNPKLKREDFYDIINMKLIEIFDFYLI